MVETKLYGDIRLELSVKCYGTKRDLLGPKADEVVVVGVAEFGPYCLMCPKAQHSPPIIRVLVWC